MAEEPEPVAAAAGPTTAASTQPGASDAQPAANLRNTVQNAADNVDAAEKFFNEPKKAAPAKPQADQSAKIAQLEREKKQLQERLEIVKNQQKIDLQHAKKKAIADAELMVSQKLNACRVAYENEFEILAT